MYFLVTDDHNYWTGGTFHHSILRALPVTEDEVNKLRRWWPERNLIATPIKWTEYVAAFIRTVRDEGAVNGHYYLYLMSPGYVTQIHSLKVVEDYTGRRSVRTKYTLQDIRQTARAFDNMTDLVSRAIRARLERSDRHPSTAV